MTNYFVSLSLEEVRLVVACFADQVNFTLPANFESLSEEEL